MVKTLTMANIYPTSRTVTPDEAIISKIYLVRNTKIMLDKDLAEMYGVETKRLNEQVR